MAGAIAALLRSEGEVEVQAIGPHAVNQAVKAIAIARSYIEPDQLDLNTVPEFVKLELQNEERTAVRFSVVCFPLEASTVSAEGARRREDSGGEGAASRVGRGGEPEEPGEREAPDEDEDELRARGAYRDDEYDDDAYGRDAHDRSEYHDDDVETVDETADEGDDGLDERGGPEGWRLRG